MTAPRAVTAARLESLLGRDHQIIAGREHLKLLDQAVTVPSPATNAIREACKEAGVVVSIGINERDGGTLYNTQLLLMPTAP